MGLTIVEKIQEVRAAEKRGSQRGKEMMASKRRKFSTFSSRGVKKHGLEGLYKQKNSTGYEKSVEFFCGLEGEERKKGGVRGWCWAVWADLGRRWFFTGFSWGVDGIRNSRGHNKITINKFGHGDRKKTGLNGRVNAQAEG